MKDQASNPLEGIGDYYKQYLRLSDELPEHVKRTFFDSSGVDDLKKNIGNPYFESIDPKIRADLIVVRNLARNAYFSIIAMYSVVSDVEMCLRMIKRYPWHGTDISKGDHFEFIWSSFANHCYIFEERAKQSGRHLTRLTAVNGGPKVTAGPWVKMIKKELGEHIAFRGAHVHEWSRNYKGYEFFKGVDFLAKFDQKYALVQKDMYFETKAILVQEIKLSQKKMIEILLNLDPDPVEIVLKYCQEFEKLLIQHQR